MVGLLLPQSMKSFDKDCDSLATQVVDASQVDKAVVRHRCGLRSVLQSEIVREAILLGYRADMPPCIY
jgi:hypothetical protein